MPGETVVVVVVVDAENTATLSTFTAPTLDATRCNSTDRVPAPNTTGTSNIRQKPPVHPPVAGKETVATTTPSTSNARVLDSGLA